MTPGSRHTTAKSTQCLLLTRRVNFLVIIIIIIIIIIINNNNNNLMSQINRRLLSLYILIDQKANCPDGERATIFRGQQFYYYTFLHSLCFCVRRYSKRTSGQSTNLNDHCHLSGTFYAL